jgi:2'-5' RNA ligase
VTFDHVTTFLRDAEVHPIVLVGNQGANAPLKELHRLLGEELHFPVEANANFRPHVTLLYDRPVEDEPIDPVSWRVKEVVLVRSHVGKTKYDWLGRWELTD